MMNPEPLANWNGALMPLADVRVSVLDRSFLFGDAIYEVIRVYHGRPFLYEDHLKRLERNLQKLQLNADCNVISERIQQTLQESGVSSGSIYIQVTRGVAPRTHYYPHPAVPTNQLIYVKSLSDPYPAERKVGASVTLIEDVRWKRCDIKSVNLLANCMGAEIAHQGGHVEAIFVEANGTLVEGTHTSLFGVQHGAILTAPLSAQILPGITRRLLMHLAAECNISVREEALHRDHLRELDELFLTGTTTEILPVVRVDEQVVGSGKPGPVVAALSQAYQQAVAKECGGQ